MQKREQGESDLEVPALGLGCMGMGMVCDPPSDRQDMIAPIGKAEGRDIIIFDADELHGLYANEKLREKMTE